MKEFQGYIKNSLRQLEKKWVQAGLIRGLIVYIYDAR